MLRALRLQGRGFESTSSHCVATLDKLLTNNCLWESNVKPPHSSHSSPGGVKANEPALGQRAIITILYYDCYYSNKAKMNVLYQYIIAGQTHTIFQAAQFRLGFNFMVRCQFNGLRFKFSVYLQAYVFTFQISATRIYAYSTLFNSHPS